MRQNSKKDFKVEKNSLKKLIDVDEDYKRSTEIIWETKFPLKKKIFVKFMLQLGFNFSLYI